jgi:hypothetical protein
MNLNVTKKDQVNSLIKILSYFGIVISLISNLFSFNTSVLTHGMLLFTIHQNNKLIVNIYRLSLLIDFLSQLFWSRFFQHAFSIVIEQK